MMNRNKLLTGLFALSLLWASCVHEPVVPTPTGPDQVSFKNQLLPFFLNTCALEGCHIGPNPPENVNLSTYELVISTGDIKAGDPDGSKLYKKLVEDSPSEVMPPGNPLPPAQIESVRLWIEQGAKNN